MLTCTHCRTENPDDARLCRECGKVLTVRDFATGVAPMPPGTEPPGSAWAAPEAAPSVLACPYCGQEVTSDAHFCPRCGKNVAAPRILTCPQCGQEVTSDAQFCPRCGKTLALSEYAGFWRRWFGYVLDSVIVLALAFIPMIVVGAVAYYAMDPPDVAFTQRQEEQQDEAAGITVLASVSVYFGVSAVYLVWLNAIGGTWGKRLLGMRLEDAETGEDIGFGRSIVRYLVSIASNAVLDLGYLWAIWDDKKQTWHDKAAGSVVVRT